MKRIAILSVTFVLCVGVTAFAGALYDNGTNVGIGTTSPGTKLHVVGAEFLQAPTNDGVSFYHLAPDGTPKTNISWCGPLHGSGECLEIDARQAFPIVFRTNNAECVRFDKDGNVMIGTTSAKSNGVGGNYKLTVNGGIFATDFRVRPTIYADFVFDKNYSLMPLPELKKSIEKHKHLPGIPSEAEVKKNGVSLSEMQVNLLQKVEELTLYVIQLKEENDKQHAEIEALKKVAQKH